MINGRYHLHNKIGQGGMGIVHRATDRLTGEIVALKQVFLPVEQIMFASKPISQSNRELRLALAHEFQTLAGLRHPNIISVLDYGFDEEQQPFFTMSYLEGAKTIVAAANGRSLPQKITLLIQMLEALAYLHRRGILHRDLKPDNVLVVGDTVRVLDFGLAAAKEQATESVGSWLYMAPEVLLGQPASEASDLYTVGVLAYRLLAGTHPFDIYAEDTIGEILAGEPDWGKMADGTANQGLTAVISQLLAKQPNVRPNSVATIAALNHALGQPLPEETTAVQESYLQAATFVGRTKEIHLLTAALKTAVVGQGSLWLIGGESGVGKSRLLHELRIQALVDGYLVLQGNGVREGGGQPYQLWRNLLRLLLLITPNVDPLTASVLLPLVPDLEYLLGHPVTPAPELDSTSQQQRLYRAIAQLITQQTQPVLLLLEDLQWTQVSLLPLLTIARHLNSQALVIVGTYRDDEPHENVTQLMTDLPDSRHMSLGRLSATDMATLSQAMLGEVGQSHKVLTLLQRETEGNAFFVVEVVRALAQEAGRLGAIGQQELPEHVFTDQMQQIVRRRLQRVAAMHQPLLQLAAVMGRQPDLRLLSHLQRDGGLDEWLTAVYETAVFVIENNQWQFAHDKLREAVLADIPPTHLPQHHATVATAIEQLYPGQSDQAAILAHHWQQAGNHTREYTSRYQAAQFASQQYAYQDALGHLTRAIATATTNDELFQTLLLQEQAWEILGNEPAREASLARLAELAQHVQQPEAKVLVAQRQAERAERQGNSTLSVAHARQTIAEAQKINYEAGIAAGYALLGNALIRLGEHAAAEETTRQSLERYLKLENHMGVGKAHISLGMIAYYQAQHIQAEQQFQAALASYKAIQSIIGLTRSYNSLGAVAYSMGLCDQAQIYYEQGLESARQLGSQREQIPLLNNLGVVTYILGLFDASRKYYESSLLIARDVHEWRSEVLALNNLGRLAFTQGQTDQATAYLLEGLTLTQGIQDRWGEGAILNNLGHVYDLQQRYNEAKSYYEQALAVNQQANQRPAIVKATLGLLHIGLQQRTHVAHLLEQLFDFLAQDPEVKGSEHVMELYLLFYRCLMMLGDERQTAVLHQAYHLLQARAALLQHKAQRHSFLDNVPEHREIIQLYEKKFA
ncbi:MAG: tetratricopeptide repeat protein [Chloroflexota bacterium]